jgi:hypothetical protein
MRIFLMLFYYVTTTASLPRCGPTNSDVDTIGMTHSVMPLLKSITPHLNHTEYKVSVIHCNLVGSVFAMLVQLKPENPLMVDDTGDTLMHLFDIPGVEAINSAELVSMIMERRRPENNGTPQNAAISAVSLFAEELLTGLSEIYKGDLLHQLIELPSGKCVYAISYPKAAPIFLAQISSDEHPHYIVIPDKQEGF